MADGHANYTVITKVGGRWSKSNVVLDDGEETVKQKTGTGSLEQKIASFQPWFYSWSDLCCKVAFTIGVYIITFLVQVYSHPLECKTKSKIHTI